MGKRLNIKLKDNIEPSILLEYGFKPKYDEDTGDVKEFIKRFHISGEGYEETYFSFVLYPKHGGGGLFRKAFYYEAWMSGFKWNDLCDKNALAMLFDLITKGIIEIDYSLT